MSHNTRGGNVAHSTSGRHHSRAILPLAQYLILTMSSSPVTSHLVCLPQIPLLTVVPAPLFAAPTPPSSPKLTAEIRLMSATSHHRASDLLGRRKAIRFSPLSVPPSRSALHGRLARPDDLVPTPFPSPAVNRAPPGISAPSPDPLPAPLPDRRSLSPFDDALSELSDSEEDKSSTVSTTSVDSEVDKIPKPVGEAGRPGRGGYNVRAALIGHSRTRGSVERTA